MKIQLPGGPVVDSETIADPSLAFFEGIAPATIKHRRTLGDLSRAAEVQLPTLVDADPGDVIELQFADGTCQWVSIAQLQEDMAARGHRSALPEGVMMPLWPIGAQTAESRDISEWALKGLKLIGFDPVGKMADLAERKIIEKFEEKLDPAEGLYPLDGQMTPGTAITKEEQLNASGTVLVFLHGTASSIAGSFGELGSTWEKLTTRYAGRVYGFQHKTLSVSPVTNALALARLIPDGATLHLVSHSRGGLVGELLCLQQISDAQLEAFRLKSERRDAEADIPSNERPDRKEACANELAALEELSALLQKRKYKIDRFVRVACPARGTILASRRIDLYLSIITSAIGLAVKSSPYLLPVHNFLKAVTIEIARRRTRPEGLPGLEAQMPESPLIHLLNGTGLHSEADLAVIAGDIEIGGGIWKSLGVVATNLYYLQKHDLVVNTEAMYAGVARKGGTWFFFDQGSDVSHFNYFRTARTRDRLLSWLAQPAGQNTDAEFQLRARAGSGAATCRSATARSTVGLPTLFILPGVMGTRLKDNAGLLWLNQARLSADGMKPLALENEGVQIDGIVQMGYQRLEEHFSSSHHVVLFPYDWRRSVADAAKNLANQVEACHRNGELVRIIAHSMGGLVARAMIALNPGLWDAVVTRGGRMVQLGTPNKGSFVIPRILWGVEATVQMLAMLDPRQSKKQVCEILALYPGLVEMLPETDDGRFFNPEWWTTDRAQLGSPKEVELKAAAALRAKISTGNTRGIVYVAGVGVNTPADLVFEGDEPVWRLTDEGDGTVPYSLGFIPGIEPYYVEETVHGELADKPEAFPAYEDLLVAGVTNRLSRTVTNRARSAPGEQFLRGPEPVLFPTEEELWRAALGIRAERPARRLPALNISIRHGDLRRSRLPLIVGHYFGDKIVNAENTLDDQLDGRLSRNLELGLYPGAEGTVELFLAPESQPPGALIVGLGQIGEISVEKVRRAVMDAAMRYAIHLVDTSRASASGANAASVGLSALLIGTNGGRALRVIDSVTAIVTGILDANKALEAANLIDRVCFDTLHIVELFETVATQAVYAARNLASRLRSERDNTQEIVVATYVESLGHGRNVQTLGRDPVQPPLNPYETGWWPRIEITAERNAAGVATGDLRFSIPTSRAGLEERITSAEAQLIDELVAQAIVSPVLDSRAPSHLFELLVPKALKPRLDVEAANALIVVDERTAKIPWEMLARRTVNNVEYLGLRIGLLRQFKTMALQPRPPDSRSFKAVVIGDTETPFAALPQAGAEAKAVADLLEAKGYERILHIAAHGMYDRNPKNPSGVVLGKNKEGSPLFLTSREIRQMPAMPELVFLNCCYLGQIDDPEEKRRLETVNALAASLAEELINKGVKAVVATGWAVNDAAARTFAEIFYSQMLKSECFGDAVRQARIVTNKEHRGVNTWAAYQCYGSPDYKLEGAGGTDATQTREDGKYDFGTRTEFLHSIRDLYVETVDGKTRTDKSRLRANLEKIELSLPAMWRDGEMLYELGVLWGALGLYDKAIELLNRALQAEDGIAPFRAAEQLANFEDRAIDAEAKAAGGASKEIIARWKGVQRRLERLNAIAETGERWSLIAASEKRRAQFEKGKQRDALLKKSIDHYRKAYERSVDANNPDPYPGLNWLTQLFLSPTTKASKAILKRELERLVKSMADRVETDTEKDMWRRISHADALLLQHLVLGDLHEAGSKDGLAPVDLVKSAYGNALNAGATARELGSAAHQIAFIKDSLARKKGAWPHRERVLSALGEIYDSLTKRG
jgi:pimeloyl-ACP methyl ester carboxylesterase/tetratricopeptide (TPR) repeat protein